jgi:hypothetical protein
MTLRKEVFLHLKRGYFGLDVSLVNLQPLGKMCTAQSKASLTSEVIHFGSAILASLTSPLLFQSNLMWDVKCINQL